MKIKTVQGRRKAKSSAVKKKRLVTPSGRVVILRSIQAESPTFERDFLTVFSDNVKEALKQKKKQSRSPGRASSAS